MMSLIPLVAVMSVVCAVLWVIDVRSHRLPNVLVYSLYPVAAIGLLVSSCLTQRAPWGSAALGMLLWGGVLAALHLLSGGRGMGMGDVKLGPVLGGVTGWLSTAAAATGLMAAFMLGGLWALGCMLRGGSRGSTIAFGPFLIMGWVVGLCVGPG
jgi:leader peptidase (prepilin peptidase)/N-methyltransferase